MSVRSNKRKAQVLQQELDRLNKELDGYDRALKNKSITPTEVQKIRDEVIYKKRRITEIEDILTRPDAVKEKTPAERAAGRKSAARATADARKSAETGTGLKDGKRVPKGKKFSSQIVARDGFINLDMVAAAQESKEITAEQAQKYRDTAKLHNEAIRNQRVVGAVRKPTTQYESKAQAERIVGQVNASGIEPSLPAAARSEVPMTAARRRARALVEGTAPQPAAKKAAPVKKAAPRAPKVAAPAEPPAAPAKLTPAPRAKKAVVAPETPVEVAKVAAKKAVAKKAAPRKATAKKVAVEPVKPSAVGREIPLSTKAGTGSQPAGPKRVTSQKLVANETAHLKKLKDAQTTAKKVVEQSPANRLAEASRARVAAANAKAGVKPAAAGQASARAADAARASAAQKARAGTQRTKVSSVSRAGATEAMKGVRAGAVRANRLSVAKSVVGKGARIAGKVLEPIGVAANLYDVASGGQKRRMAAWDKDHPNASLLDRAKAAAKNVVGDPYLMDKYDTEKAPPRKAGNLKGSVRGHGTGGALQKAKKAPVGVPNVPRSPSIKTGTKAPQKPAVGALGASTHVVKRGDTLWDIAQANKTTVSSLLKANPTIAERRAKGQTSIFSGTKVRIPKGK